MTGDQASRLLELLEPILAHVARLEPGKCTSADEAASLRAELEAAFPADGERASAIGAELRRGIEEGWLCNRGEPTARFSRVAKACPDTHDLSVDAVSLQGAAVPHVHPQGEVTLGFPAPGSDASVRFDGHPPGWVVMPANSRHTPTVTHGRMHLIYFLPAGAIQWLPPE